MSSIYSIYSAFCVVTGQRYLGFDSNWPKRKTAHKREYSKQKYNTKFYNAIKKYGWDSFVWEVLYQAKENESPRNSHTMNVMEPHFIKEYDSHNNGYNMTDGGDGGPILLGERNGMFGKTHTGEVCKNLSELAIKRFKNKSYEELYGQEKANQLKRIRSEQMRGIDNSKSKNPRFDAVLWKFYNTETKQLVISTQYDFYMNGNLPKSSTNEIVKKRISRRNWTVLDN